MDLEPINDSEGDGGVGEQEIRQDLGKILEALREDRRALNVKLEDMARKQDNFPVLLSDLERRQSTAMDTFRRDIERLFVPRAEYEPRHQVLLDKIREYDTIISDANRQRDEYAKYKAAVDRHEEDIDDLQKHNEGGMSRAIAWIGIVVAVGSFLFNFLQHVSFR